jgi:hypothetical protein
MVLSTHAIRVSVVPEYVGAELGDERRSRRLVGIARRLQSKPRAPIPEAMQSSAELEGFYRFVNNPEIDTDDILAPHHAATLERAERAGTVLVVHDTTHAEFPGRVPRRGLGMVTTKHSHGFLAHVSLAVQMDEGRTPLGVLGMKTFTRTGTKWSRVKKSRTRVRDDPARESLRWWAAMEAIEHDRKGRFEAIHVMDAEADFFELLRRAQDAGTRFVVRVGQQKRNVRDGDDLVSLREIADRMVPSAWRSVQLSARYRLKRELRSRLKKHPARAGRTARLAMAACPIRLHRTRYSRLGGEVKLTLVRVWEPDPPPNTPAVEWLLLTSEPAKTKADLVTVVDIYRARWVIEEYFKALKTGCALEQRQIDSYEALTKATAIFVPIAYRLLLLRALERQRPNASPREYFSDSELRILRSHDATRDLAPLKTLADAMLYLARMGGHLKHNGSPGWQTLGRGYEELLSLKAGWEAASAPANVGRRSDQS